MDPYVIIEYDKVTYRTPTNHKAGKSPSWNYTIELTLTSLNGSLRISCFAENIMTDSLVGETTVKIIDLCENEESS